MTPELVQLLTVAAGLLATLGGVALTHWYLGRAEEKRLAAQDRRRWHDQRYRTISDLIAAFMQADYRLADLCNALPDDVGRWKGIERARLVTTDPDTGRSQVFEPDWVYDLMAAGKQVNKDLDAAHRLVVDLSIVVSGAVVDLAWEVLQGYTDSAVAVSEYATSEEAWAPLVNARVRQKDFVVQARRLLGAEVDDGSIEAIQMAVEDGQAA